MVPGLTEIKSGKPAVFPVTYLDREFLAELHDVSPITESKETITNPASPAQKGLERVIVIVNSIREKRDDPKKTSSDFDSEPTLLDGKVSPEIRPGLEGTIRQAARTYGYVLDHASFIYPQGD